MANRTVSVNLIANIGQYVSGMNAAAGATMRLGDTATASSKKAQSGFDLAGKGALLMGAAVVGGMAMAVSKSMEFEKAMSAAAAATRATGAALGDLRDAAMKAGADTAYSATEAAQAITEMGKAGVSTADILDGGLNGALSLAAAGQLDVAKAAEIASVAMTQFSLSGDQLPHVADLLAAGAGKAMGSVEDLGMALNQAGLVASSTGLSIEETTGSLAAFASAGLVGSDAGTSLRSMLLHLQNATGPAAAAMEEYGISLYDASGNFVGMESLAGQLQTKLGGLTQETRDAAMAQIFGSDAVRAANVLYKEGSDGIANWTAKVNDAGYAADQAARLQDNLAGDLEKLGGAFDTFLISIGEGAQGPLRELVQGLTGILDVGTDLIGFWQALPGPVQVAIVTLAAVAALKGPVGGALETIGLRAMYARDAMAGASLSMGGLRTAGAGLLGVFGGPWGLAITGATVGLSLLVSWLGNSSDASADAAAYQRDLAAALRESGGALDENVRALAAQAAADKEIDGSNMLAVAEKLGFDLPRVTDALLGNKDAYNELADAANHYIDESLKFENAGDPKFAARAESARLFLQALDELAPSQAAAATTNRQVAEATGETGAAMQGATVMTEEATAALEEWLKQLQGISAGFVEPLGTYTDLLGQKQESERASAEATAAATESSSDSWEDYVSDVGVSLDEYATKLEEQLLAQDNWRMNIATITQRGGYEVGQILAGMGEEGVQLAADMANGTDAEFNRMADLLIEDARRGGAGAAAALDQEMKVMAAVGAAGASATAWAISEQLGIGVGRVAEIAAQYGLNLALGIDPLLAALGKPGTSGRMASAQSLARQRGLYDGGYTGDGDKYEPAGIVHRGEYVLTKEQTARLGIDRIEEFANNGYANGGFVTAADVPRPNSTAPYQMPISTGGDATMQAAYDEATAWLRAHIGTAGSGAVTGQWMSLWNLVKTQIPAARMNSTFRPGDPGYHGRNKAVDFGYGTGPGGAGSAGLASINRLLHDQVGRNLAELIYDGIGDDRPDLKNGKPLTYSAGTRAAHKNHVHAAVYDQGGPLYPGYTLAYNGTGKTEWVNKSREFSGGGGGGTVVRVAAPDLRGLTIQGRVTIDGNGIATIAGQVVDQAIGDLANGMSARGVHV